MLEMLCGVSTYLNKEVMSSNHVKRVAEQTK